MEAINLLTFVCVLVVIGLSATTLYFQYKIKQKEGYFSGGGPYGTTNSGAGGFGSKEGYFSGAGPFGTAVNGNEGF